MICVECLNHVTTACQTKRKCMDANEQLKKMLLQKSRLVQVQSEIATEVLETASCDSLEAPADRVNEPVKAQRQSLRSRKVTGKLAPPSSEVTATTSSLVKVVPILKLTKSAIKKLFQCDLCGFESNRKHNLDRHLLSLHIKATKFPCSFDGCLRQYTTRSALKLHLVRDHGESSSFDCKKCHQRFSCQSLLKIHQQRLTCRPRKLKAAPAEKKLSCTKCDFKTAHQFSLNQHMNLIHLNIRKTWKCDLCEDAVFSNRTSFNQHAFAVHNKSHVQCPDCDQNFTDESQLSSHKESFKCQARKATDDDFTESATGETTCNLCKRSYRTKKEWTTHYFNHHKFKTVCDICNLQLATYASLKNHIKTIHEKVRAFACTECPKKFSQKHTLQFHMNLHTGQKPFGCKFCKFKAADRSSISKHQKKMHPS